MGRKSEPLFINSERIKELLKQKKLKQKDLAKELGYSPNSVSRFLKRKTAENNLTIQKIADFLGVDPYYISINYKNYFEDLNHLSLEQLQDISNACNYIIQKQIKEKEAEKLKEIEPQSESSRPKGITKEIREFAQRITKRKTVFVTSDGTEFDTKLKAILYENKETNQEIYSNLKKAPPTKYNETDWCYCSTKEEFNAFKQIWAEKKSNGWNSQVNEAIYSGSFSEPDWYCFRYEGGRWRQIRLTKEKEKYDKLFKRFESDV